MYKASGDDFFFGALKCHHKRPGYLQEPRPVEKPTEEPVCV